LIARRLGSGDAVQAIDQIVFVPLFLR